MKTWKLLLLAAVFPLLASCDNEADKDAIDLDANLIRFEAVHPAQVSRVTATNFEKADQIGVYMTTADLDLQLGGNEINNENFTYDGRTWNSVRKLYWNKGNHNVYAYYPFNSSVNSITDYKYKVALDQNQADLGNGLSGYESSDFLWATASNVTASANPVQLKFAHCMSKMNIVLKKSENFEGEIPNDAEVFILNTVSTASIDLSTGGVSKDPYSGAETIKALKLSPTEFTACLVPQKINSRRPLVEVITQGVSYLMEGKISLKPGVQHTVVITLTKNPDQTKIEIGGEIVDWK